MRCRHTNNFVTVAVRRCARTLCLLATGFSQAATTERHTTRDVMAVHVTHILLVLLSKCSVHVHFLAAGLHVVTGCLPLANATPGCCFCCCCCCCCCFCSGTRPKESDAPGASSARTEAVEEEKADDDDSVDEDIEDIDDSVVLVSLSRSAFKVVGMGIDMAPAAVLVAARIVSVSSLGSTLLVPLTGLSLQLFWPLHVVAASVALGSSWAGLRRNSRCASCAVSAAPAKWSVRPTVPAAAATDASLCAARRALVLLPFGPHNENRSDGCCCCCCCCCCCQVRLRSCSFCAIILCRANDTACACRCRALSWSRVTPAPLAIVAT